MKKIYTIIIFTISLITYGQTGVISYNVENITVSDHDMAKKINAELELMEFTLTFDSKNSHFKKEKNIYKDLTSSKLALGLINATDDFFQTNTSKESFSNKTISNEIYQVNRSYRMSGWELTNETAVINNYTCYKAILTEYNTRSETYYKTIAWYTPEIPISYGPIGYGGLPGAILQLQFKKSIYRATLIILNPKKINVTLMEEGEKIDYKEMVKLMRAARKVTVD